LQVLGGFLSVLRSSRGWTKADVVTNIFVLITIGKPERLSSRIVCCLDSSEQPLTFCGHHHACTSGAGVILQGGAILCLLGYRKDLADNKKPTSGTEGGNQGLKGIVDPTLSPEENKLLVASLPEFVKKRDYWELMVSEMGRRHDYVSIAMVRTGPLKKELIPEFMC
jgi:hypothetical protein